MKMLNILTRNILVIIICWATFPLAAQQTITYANSKAINNSANVSLNLEHIDEMVIATTSDKILSFDVKLIFDKDVLDKATLAKIKESIEFAIEDKNNGVYVDFSSPFKSHQITQGWLLGNKTKIILKTGEKLEFDEIIDFEITVNVNVPNTNQIDIKSEFSKLNMNNIDSKVTMNLSHTTVHTNDLGELDLTCEFSKINLGNINGNALIKAEHSNVTGLNVEDVNTTQAFSTIEFAKAKHVTGRLEHSTFIANQTSDLNISSAEFSKLELNNAGKVILKTIQHSKLNLGSVSDLAISDGAFTKITADEVKNLLRINASYCNMEVLNLDNDIQVIDITNHFATVSLGTQKIEGFDLYVHNGEFTKVRTKSETIEKKSDGYYRKRLSGKNIREINVTCPHCTVVVK